MNRKQLIVEGYYRHNLGETGRTRRRRSIATAASDRVPPERVPMDRTHWMRVMREGQLTRDPVLRTRKEIEKDRRRAEALAARRKARFPSADRESVNVAKQE